jgi:hypothetical protein
MIAKATRDFRRRDGAATEGPRPPPQHRHRPTVGPCVEQTEELPR